ncbi:MAG: hypothetical protein HYW28_04280 [Rhodospirillales bacterium]|nr:hypothetical protein [Rhodospirillales bacterium]
MSSNVGNDPGEWVIGRLDLKNMPTVLGVRIDGIRPAVRFDETAKRLAGPYQETRIDLSRELHGIRPAQGQIAQVAEVGPGVDEPLLQEPGADRVGGGGRLPVGDIVGEDHRYPVPVQARRGLIGRVLAAAEVTDDIAAAGRDAQAVGVRERRRDEKVKVHD